MGHWRIVVEGFGPHHNKAVGDADWIAGTMLDHLRLHTHRVSQARFETTTSSQSLLPPDPPAVEATPEQVAPAPAKRRVSK